MSSITIDLAGFKSQLADYSAKLQAATRPAAQAGAQVIYERARLNVHSSDKGHWFYGTSFKKTGQRYWFEPGSLRNAIYQVYSQDKSTDRKATYHISWNRTKAPYGHMVELGTSRAPAHPFLAPAIHDGAESALQAMRETFIERMQA